MYVDWTFNGIIKSTRDGYYKNSDLLRWEPDGFIKTQFENAGHTVELKQARAI